MVRVVVGDEEDVGLGVEQEVARVEVDADDERLAVFAQPREELAGGLERGRAVRGALLYRGQSQPEGARRVESGTGRAGGLGVSPIATSPGHLPGAGGRGPGRHVFFTSSRVSPAGTCSMAAEFMQ